MPAGWIPFADFAGSVFRWLHMASLVQAALMEFLIASRASIYSDGLAALDAHSTNYECKGPQSLVLLWWEWPLHHWEGLRVGSSMNFMAAPTPGLVENQAMNEQEVHVATEFFDELIALNVLLEAADQNLVIKNNFPLCLVPKAGQPGTNANANANTNAKANTKANTKAKAKHYHLNTSLLTRGLYSVLFVLISKLPTNTSIMSSSDSSSQSTVRSYSDVASSVYPDSVAKLIGLSSDEGGALVAHGLLAISEPMCLDIFQMKQGGTRYLCMNVACKANGHGLPDSLKAEPGYYRSGAPSGYTDGPVLRFLLGLPARTWARSSSTQRTSCRRSI